MINNNRRRYSLIRIPRYLVLSIIAVYRLILSPLISFILGPACRFEPTCSVYASQAIARYGITRGVRMAFGRLLRCRPLGGWGYDPVPDFDRHTRSIRSDGTNGRRDSPKGLIPRDTVGQ